MPEIQDGFSYFRKCQEAYDNTIQAIRIAEHPEIQLPVMVLMDGFIISHSIDRLDLQDDASVKKFIGSRNPAYSLLDAQNPISVGNFDPLYGYFFEFKRQQEEGMLNALKVIQDVGKEFEALSGRPYGLLEAVGMKNAEYAVIATASAAGDNTPLKVETTALQRSSYRVNQITALFRPFPSAQLQNFFLGLTAVAVFDRSILLPANLGGPIFIELRSSLFDLEEKPRVINYI